MQEKEVIRKAKLRSGKARAAREHLREEMQSPEQAIAIGLSKVFRAVAPLMEPSKARAVGRRASTASKAPATKGSTVRRKTRKTARTRRRRSR